MFPNAELLILGEFKGHNNNWMTYLIQTDAGLVEETNCDNFNLIVTFMAVSSLLAQINIS